MTTQQTPLHIQQASDAQLIHACRCGVFEQHTQENQLYLLNELIENRSIDIVREPFISKQAINYYNVMRIAGIIQYAEQHYEQPHHEWLQHQFDHIHVVHPDIHFENINLFDPCIETISPQLFEKLNPLPDMLPPAMDTITIFMRDTKAYHWHYELTKNELLATIYEELLPHITYNQSPLSNPETFAAYLYHTQNDATLTDTIELPYHEYIPMMHAVRVMDQSDDLSWDALCGYKNRTSHEQRTYVLDTFLRYIQHHTSYPSWYETYQHTLTKTNMNNPHN